MMQWENDLSENVIYLWVCSDLLSPKLDGALEFLAPDEQERARRYRYEKDRWRYLGGTFLQRVVLGRYLPCSFQEFSFSRNKWGKPTLDQRHYLKFSLSRSHEVAILAVCAEREVGTDLEYALGRNNGDLRMKEQFSEGEQEFIDSASDSKKAFFEIWARKEAYIKGIGRGLSHPLAEFDVTPNDEKCVRDWSAEAPDESWQVRSLELPEEGYAAAIATTFEEFSVELVQVEPDELLDGISGCNGARSIKPAID